MESKREESKEEDKEEVEPMPDEAEGKKRTRSNFP